MFVRVRVERRRPRHYPGGRVDRRREDLAGRRPGAHQAAAAPGVGLDHLGGDYTHPAGDARQTAGARLQSRGHLA